MRPSLRAPSPTNTCWVSRAVGKAATQYRIALLKSRRLVAVSQPNNTPATSNGIVRARIASAKLAAPSPAIVTSRAMTPPVTTAVRAPASGPRRMALGQRAEDEPAPKRPAEVQQHPDAQGDVVDQARSQLLGQQPVVDEQQQQAVGAHHARRQEREDVQDGAGAVLGPDPRQRADAEQDDDPDEEDVVAAHAPAPRLGGEVVGHVRLAARERVEQPEALLPADDADEQQ